MNKSGKFFYTKDDIEQEKLKQNHYQGVVFIPFFVVIFVHVIINQYIRSLV